MLARVWNGATFFTFFRTDIIMDDKSTAYVPIFKASVTCPANNSPNGIIEYHLKITGTVLKTRNDYVGTAKVGQELLGRSQMPKNVRPKYRLPIQRPSLHPHRHREVKIS